jgi:hypothetical protein
MILMLKGQREAGHPLELTTTLLRLGKAAAPAGDAHGTSCSKRCENERRKAEEFSVVNVSVNE